MRLLLDENFNWDIRDGVLKRVPEADFLTVQQVPGLVGAGDPAVLEWAAQHGRIVLTHDKKTMKDFAYDRADAGLLMPGVFIVIWEDPIGPIIDNLVNIITISDPQEWNWQVRFLPIN